MKNRLLHGLSGALLIVLSGAANAETYCPILYLYATHIRAACEQLGANGLASLYQTNRFIDRLLHTHGKVTARTH